MASRKAITRVSILSTSALFPRHALRSSPRLLAPVSRQTTPALASFNPLRNQQQRWQSKPAGEDIQVYDFAQVNALVHDTSAVSTVVLDVREPAEYNAGFIPTALNMPITSHPDALFLPPDEFRERFGFSKPLEDQKVLFYCKSGVRSSAAAQLARQAGYQDVVEYKGSWLDWEKNGGEKGGAASATS